jgi:segregation and condensation protein B
MESLEKTNIMDDAPQNVQDAVSQLSFAYRRSEDALTGNADQALTEGIRRAEAILFAAGEPLSADQISRVLPQGIEAAEVLMALRALYAQRGVSLVEVAGKWRFQTAQDLAFLFVEERQVQKKLGQAALETLAIIAYGQPVTRAEVEAVRGVAVSKSTMDTLLETGWVKTAGHRKTPGLPIEYKTTDTFLEHFGLESLNTLPGKADLEAEGLLSDVIPESLMMPDEEALSEEETLIDDSAESDVGGDQFVTDFMEDDEASEADVVIETVPFDEAAEAAANAVDGDEIEDNGLSVFSYTRDTGPSEPVEDDNGLSAVTQSVSLDQTDIQAAIIKMRSETREPQRPMSDWTDED